MKVFWKIFIVSVAVILLLPIFVSAQAPGIPHKFFGAVNFSSGSTPDGLLVEAKINNITIGSSVTANGNYGYNPNLLLATDPQNSNAGKTVEFYVSGIKASETAVFTNGQSAELNLTVVGNVGTIEETDESKTIENKTALVTSTQTANIKLGNNLSITVSSTTDTNAVINRIAKLGGSFFSGSAAIIAGNNLLNGFEIDISGDDLTISVTITYDDTGIDENTVKPYKFNGTSWVVISPYSQNKSANTITFNVSSAQTPYVIFGSPPASSSSTGGGSTTGTGGGTSGGTETTTPSGYKSGDINQDNKVDIFDFNVLMVNWGDSPVNVAADLDGNGKVDIFDFNLLMVNWTG